MTCDELDEGLCPDAPKNNTATWGVLCMSRSKCFVLLSTSIKLVRYQNQTHCADEAEGPQQWVRERLCDTEGSASL
jgi:hypothetical protein